MSGDTRTKRSMPHAQQQKLAAFFRPKGPEAVTEDKDTASVLARASQHSEGGTAADATAGHIDAAVPSREKDTQAAKGGIASFFTNAPSSRNGAEDSESQPEVGIVSHMLGKRSGTRGISETGSQGTKKGKKHSGKPGIRSEGVNISSYFTRPAL